MTNNKHKEIMEEIDRRFVGWKIHHKSSPCIKDTFVINEIKEFISSALTEQLEELEKVLEKVKIKGYHNKENIEKAKFLQELYDEHIKPVILSHIREQKEIINKNN